MKILRIFRLLASTVLSMTLIASCNQNLDLSDDSFSYSEVLRMMNKKNKTVSLDGDIEFQILTPNGLAGVAYKNFIMSANEEGDFMTLDGKSYFSVTSEGRYANDIVSIMGYADNLSASKPGDKLNLQRVTCGNMLSNNSDIAFATFEGGDIYVKNISDTAITLRFAKVKTNNALGDSYFNGDLTFDIE